MNLETSFKIKQIAFLNIIWFYQNVFQFHFCSLQIPYNLFFILPLAANLTINKVT